jgi:hypothetical protein
VIFNWIVSFIIIINLYFTNDFINFFIISLIIILVFTFIIQNDVIFINFNLIYVFIDVVPLKRNPISFSFFISFMVIALDINLDRYRQECCL